MKMKTSKLLLVMCASLVSATAIGGTNYVIAGNGVPQNFQTVGDFASNPSGGKVQKSLSGLEEKELGVASFKGMPKSAYKITITVKCNTMRNLDIANESLGQALVNDKSKMNIVGKIDGNEFNHAEICGYANERMNLSTTSISNKENNIETLAWVVDTLKPGRHEFMILAFSNIEADIATSEIKNSYISYSIMPSVQLLNVFIEPVVIKY